MCSRLLYADGHYYTKTNKIIEKSYRFIYLDERVG